MASNGSSGWETELVCCPNAGCVEKLVRRDVRDHVKLTCKKRYDLCEYCVEVNLRQDELELHKVSCVRRPLKCDCGEMMQFFSHADHKLVRCPTMQIACPLYSFGKCFSGCSGTAARGALKDHVLLAVNGDPANFILKLVGDVNAFVEIGNGSISSDRCSRKRSSSEANLTSASDSGGNWPSVSVDRRESFPVCPLAENVNTTTTTSGIKRKRGRPRKVSAESVNNGRNQCFENPTETDLLEGFGLEHKETIISPTAETLKDTTAFSSSAVDHNLITESTLPQSAESIQSLSLSSCASSDTNRENCHVSSSGKALGVVSSGCTESTLLHHRRISRHTRVKNAGLVTTEAETQIHAAEASTHKSTANHTTTAMTSISSASASTLSPSTTTTRTTTTTAKSTVSVASRDPSSYLLDSITVNPVHGNDQSYFDTLKKLKNGIIETKYVVEDNVHVESKGKYYGTVNADRQKHGRGTMIYNNGDIYIGHWKNNHHEDDKLKKEKSIMRYANGDIYCGAWVGDKRNGDGELWCVSGDYFEGNWTNNKLDGRAYVYNASDGTYFEGQLKNGKYHCSKGTFTFQNGDEYNGSFVHGKMTDTDGSMVYKTIGSYLGNVVDGKRHGEGVMTYSSPTKETYNGVWENDEPKAVSTALNLTTSSVYVRRARTERN